MLNSRQGSRYDDGRSRNVRRVNRVIVILLGIASGAALGYVLTRGDVCFHSAFRGLVTPSGDRSLFKAYALGTLIQIPILLVLSSLGVITPWIPPFQPVANSIGGLIFGIGLVVA